MSEADGWEARSSARARELAQWGSLKDRISPLLSNPDTWSVTRAQRVASEASRVNRGKAYEPEPQDESPLRVLGRMLEVGADTFRDIVPQEVRDVGGAVLNNVFSGERALNTWDRVTRAPGEAVGGAIARGLGLDTSRAEETRAQQRPLGTMLGETVEQVPGVGGLLRTGLDVAAAPATILTAGVGGAVGGALRGGGRGGRILANLIEPVAPRGVGFGGRLAAETAAGVGATEGAQYAADQVDNPYAKVGLGLLGGVAGGMAGAGLAAQGRAIARGGVTAARPSIGAFADEAGSMNLDDYAGEHRAPLRDGGAPGHDLTGGGEIYPDDVYSSNAVRYYGTGDDKLDREVWGVIQRMRGNPNSQVTIYRAVPHTPSSAERIQKLEARQREIMRRGSSDPKEYDRNFDEIARLREAPSEGEAIDSINPGDWVTVSRQYAKDHGEGALRGEYRIISKKVRARDIYTNGDSWAEWGYDPQSPAIQGGAGASGVAPHGPVRIGDRVFYHATRDPEIGIGDLQVGRPTRNQHEVFGTPMPYETTRSAVFLTESKELAEQFGDRVLEARVDPGKVVSLRGKRRTEIIDAFERWAFDRWRSGGSAAEAYRITGLDVKNRPVDMPTWKLFDGAIGEHFSEFLQERGFNYATFDESVPRKSGGGSARGITLAVLEPRRLRPISGGAGQGGAEPTLMKVYHGTNSGAFERFDPSRRGAATDEGLLGAGYYTSTDPAIGRNRVSTLAGQVSLSNPLRISFPEWAASKGALVNDALGTDSLKGESLSAALRERGYDGVILDYSPVGYQHQEIMALDESAFSPLRPISGGAGQGGVFDFGPRTSSGTREAVIGDTTITYGVNPNSGIAEVTLVETPPNARRRGSARAAMEQMIREADEQGITLALTADPIGRGGASKTALEKFYQSLGFRKNTGRNADYRVWSQYVRKPKTVSGGAGAGGVAPPPALAQVFGIEEPAQGLTRAQEFRNTIKEALGQPMGLVVDDPIATPATQARARWADQITSAATIEGDQARRIIEAAGFQFDEKWGIPALNGKGSIPGNPTLQDVAARLPEYAPYLDPTQFQAIERIAKLMDPYGEVIRQTVGDLSPRGDVQPGGYYLHRGFEPEPEVRISIGGKIGGKAGFEKEAAYDSMAEAVAAGKTPLAPWDSIREYVADVGTRASDRYYADYLKSTTDALGNKLGMTSADRVPVGLRKRMEDLRSKISARTQLLRGQEARGKAAEAELGRAERGAQEAGARVVQAYGKRAALPDVTAEDISAARQSVTDAISEARSLAAEIADHAAKLKGTQNGLNAREREIVAEAGRLEQTLAEADQLGLAADRLLSETRVTDLIRTPDTTVARYLEAGFPQEEQIRGRIDELSKLVTRGADGAPNEGASNVARLQEIGELQALDDIRYALGETGQWDDAALTKLEAVLEDVSRSLEVRDDAAMRARNRNAGGQYGGSEGMSGDIDSLRARAALLFRVWDSGSLEVPVPQLSGEAVDNATRTAVARAEANLKKAGGRALEREQRLLLRQADKIETGLRNLTDGAERMAERVDLATERGAILGDMDQAARQQLVESRRHERAILAGDRRIGAMDREIRILEQAERRAQRNVSAADVRAQRASARAGQTGADLAQLKAERDALAGDWEHAKALARQTPQGRAAIGLAELQGTDFPTQMANAANRILQSEMSTSGRLSQTIRSMAALNNLLRGMRATADWSFAGIQGAIGLANDPRAYWQAMKTAYQVLGDPNMRAAALGQWDEQNLAQGFLGMRGWTAAGIHQGASQTEYTLRGGPLKALTQTPGIGAPARGVKAVVEGANEAFGTFGDLLRMYHADMLLKRALAKGQIDQAAVLRAQQGMIDPRIRAIANHANLVTGWSPNKFGGEMGDVIQFAPRFFQSQLELSANALMKGGIEGKLARREMLQYLGLAAGTTVLANLALGNGFGEWAKPFKDDSFEKNPNFMRIRAGGRDYSLFGPWDSLLTAMMSAGKGDLGYLARTKASPMVQMTWDLLTGEDFMGNRVEPGANWDFAEWMAKQVTPFSLQDIPATAQQALEGDVFGAGLGLLTETAGVKSSPMTPNEELDAIAQRTAGKPYWNLEPYQREAIKAANPDVWQRSVARGSDARQRAEVVRSEYHAKQLKSDNDLLSGAVTRQQWRDQRSTRRVEQRARLEEIYGDATKRSSEPRNVYERYLALIDASVNPDTGQPDWEAVDAGLARMPAADQAEIEKSVGVGQTPLSREYAKLSKAYYALPRYKGFTADQAREIDAAWTEVKNASETQLGRLRKVRELQEAGVEEAVLKGVRARAMGKSLEEAPDRERFKKENPRYKVLSGSGKLTEADRAILDEVLRAAA